LYWLQQFPNVEPLQVIVLDEHDPSVLIAWEGDVELGLLEEVDVFVDDVEVFVDVVDAWGKVSLVRGQSPTG
jgi:hypothetical protein